jgi:asparagine synthase (glutamine-hydrolysing)
MCGIFGYWDRRRRAMPDGALSAMAQKLAHRGPDDEGVWHQPERGVAIGNRRLSIIDIGGGHQPFVSDDGRIAVVQNGEIFNYVELAAELRAQGAELRSHSDTEVLLRLYEREGISFLRKLNGMFAIAIDDAREDAMYLVRDRIGVKPLYFADDGTRAIFASEIKAMLPWTGTGTGFDGMDLEAIHHYLTFNYIPAPWTIWRGLRVGGICRHSASRTSSSTNGPRSSCPSSTTPRASACAPTFRGVRSCPAASIPAPSSA